MKPHLFGGIRLNRQAIRRQMQVEAAERRRNENESRGIKDVDKVRRQQQRAAQLEKDELEAAKHGTAEPALRVSAPDWRATFYAAEMIAKQHSLIVVLVADYLGAAMHRNFLHLWYTTLSSQQLYTNRNLTQWTEEKNQPNHRHFYCGG